MRSNNSNNRGARTARNERGARTARPVREMRIARAKRTAKKRGARSVPVATKTQSGGLSREQLVDFYRNMLLSREIDEEEIRLKGKGFIYFQINGCGHEAICTAAALALSPGYDWFFPYYRDRALVLKLGMTPAEMFMTAAAAADEPAGAGRQMPSHWGHPRINIVNQSSCTGSQLLHAVGCMEAWSKGRDLVELRDRIHKWQPDEVALVTVGEGTTSEGEFYEALNSACNLKLPVIFLVEDNGYAISVPVEVNTAGGSISNLVSGFPNLAIYRVDGCDPIASYAVMTAAVAGCRAGQGPALVHAKVIRPYSHSLSDDERLYKPAAERAQESKRDPITAFPRFLLKERILKESDLARIREEVLLEVRQASDEAVAAVKPAPVTVLDHLYSPIFDPCDRALATEPVSQPESQPTTMVDLLNSCMRDEMRRDPRIVIFGEDVADATHAEVLDECKGKGGVFKVTFGLQREFGATRVYNSPLAEANIVGRAIGLAVRGMKPVVEIQFLDYIWPAYHQIRSELSLMRWRSHGGNSCPVVVRVASGGYLRGGAVYHSQSAETLFTHLPGLRVVMPATALDANGLLRTAIRCDDPVIFLEHKHLYRQTYNKGVYPGPDYAIPFGLASRVRAGSDLTVVTYGALVQRTFVAAKKLAEENGIEAEILDLRTLNPYDWEAIAESVRKTSRVIVAHEESRSWGFGAEIAARIGDELFDDLDAPVRRIGAMDCHVAYCPELEEVILPQSEGIYAEMLALSQY